MKFGGRFSLKAFMPSVWSAVANAEWNSLRSYSSPSVATTKARLTASLAIRDADSDIWEMVVATAFASRINSSAGTTRDTRPLRIGFFGVDGAAGQDQVHRLGLADGAGQPL